MEAPRGTLTHWAVIENPTIRRSCRARGTPARAAARGWGPYEAALMDNHKLHDPKQPIEFLRTIHAFDPCLACAVHLFGPDGEDLVTVRVS